MVEIRTERLLLRPAQPSDLDAFHEILSDPRAMANWSTLPHRDVDETRAWLHAMSSIDPGEGEDFAIDLDGRVIGKAGFYRFPEIGFILHPRMWGRGFAKEALGPILTRAFNCHGLGAVQADVDPRNEASLRLLRRLGFEETGRAASTWEIGEQWCDSVYLTLHASALLRKTGA